MTFLEFPDEQKKKPSSKLIRTESDAVKMTTKAEKILNRVPPKIEPIKSSEVLSRAAAFLPQLAASNRAILQKRPEDVNIEVLNGQESEIIEMKLGLGVFEEKSKRTLQGSESETSETESENEDGTKKKILILPSEIKAAAAEQNNKIDAFEKVINSLLLFATDDEEEEDGEQEGESNNLTSDSDDDSMDILDFD